MINHQKKLIVFGGILDVTHEKNDILVFDTETNSWDIAEQSTQWMIIPQIPISKPTNKKTVSPKKAAMKYSSLPASPRLRNLKAQAPKIINLNSEQLSEASYESPQNARASPASYRSPRNANPCKLRIPSTERNTDSKSTLPLINKSLFVSGAMTSPRAGRMNLASTVIENRKKEKLLKKMNLLKEFEVSEEEAAKLRNLTPLTMSLKKSLKNLTLTSAATERDKSDAEFIGDITINKIVKKEEKMRTGVKPVARDGHTATLLGNKMYIFAGDRHRVSFNDMFGLDLKYFEDM